MAQQQRESVRVSAALAVLAYEQPPSLEERSQVSNDPNEVLRYSNVNVRKGLDSGKSSEYTVSMASNNSASGCAACEKRAGGGEHVDTRGSDYGWWKDIERWAKDKRKDIEREVKKEKNEIIQKIKELPMDAAREFARRLKGIDDDYRRCKMNSGKKINYPSDWDGSVTGDYCNDIAVHSARNLISTSRFLYDLFFDVSPTADRTIGTLLQYDKYGDIRRGIYNAIRTYVYASGTTEGTYLLDLFSFLNSPI